LLHASLRKLLGQHVTQKGSLVAAERLRFDFSYHGAINAQQLQAIEDEVNGLIRRNTATQTALMHPDDAIKTGEPVNHAAQTKSITDPGKFFAQLQPWLHEVEEIYFAGGEPLFIDEHYELLDELLEGHKIRRWPACCQGGLV